jgi:hypothetical protein
MKFGHWTTLNYIGLSVYMGQIRKIYGLPTGNPRSIHKSIMPPLQKRATKREGEEEV